MRRFHIFLLVLISISLAAPAFAGSSNGRRKGNTKITDNFSPSSKSSSGAKQKQGQQQGQQQGQVGINKGYNKSYNKNNNSSYSGVKFNDELVEFEEEVVDMDMDLRDLSHTFYEAPEIPVNSAAPVFAGSCSQGASVQTASFGASAGTGNPVCDYVAVAGGLAAAGERAGAVRVLGKAENAADWRYRLSQIRNVVTLGLF